MYKTYNLQLTTYNSAGFTLVEVIVALVILVSTAAGIFASFIAAQGYSANAKRRIVAVNFARQKLEELRPEVRQDTWNTGGLKITAWTPYEPLPATLPGDGRRYQVESVPGVNYRKVTVEIKYDM